MSPVRTMKAVGARFAAPAGASRARAASGEYRVITAEEVRRLEQRAASAEAENAVLRAELDIQRTVPAARR